MLCRSQLTRDRKTEGAKRVKGGSRKGRMWREDVEGRWGVDHWEMKPSG